MSFSTSLRFVIAANRQSRQVRLVHRQSVPIRGPSEEFEAKNVLTLCIRYKIDPQKLSDFEAYAKAWPETIGRCGGKLVGYYLPTKIAGPTDFALALIDFPDLSAYERYRDNLMTDREALENVRRADQAGCILVEDRAFLRRAS